MGSPSSGGDGPARSDDNGDAADAETNTFSEQRAFDLLAAERRRFVVRVLEVADGPVGVEELVRRVGSLERGGSPDDLEAETIETLRLRLFHVHLPELSAAGVIEYDSDTGTIAATPRLEDLRQHNQALFG